MRNDTEIAVKAIVELASYKVIDPTHPLVTAVKSWCSDKLRGYLSMFPTDIPKPAEKPPETQPGGKLEGKAIDCGVDMEWMRETCKKIKWSDAVCMSWIEASFKVKRAETLEKTIALLDKDQKAKLCDFVGKAAIPTKN